MIDGYAIYTDRLGFVPVFCVLVLFIIHREGEVWKRKGKGDNLKGNTTRRYGHRP